MPALGGGGVVLVPVVGLETGLATGCATELAIMFK